MCFCGRLGEICFQLPWWGKENERFGKRLYDINISSDILINHDYIEWNNRKIPDKLICDITLKLIFYIQTRRRLVEMAMKIILDALIPREDFDLKDESGVAVNRNVLTMSVTDLDYNSFMYSAIKKPDFQRETNEWSPEKVHQLVLSFLEGELIPSIILWKSLSNHIFVIDGSHRISALIAWVNDDYGDGFI